MNNAKVTVPQSVATAIAHFVNLADTKTEALQDILAMGYETEQSEIILRHFDGDYDVLMEALVCGYEIEKLAEEKVREYYDELYVIASNYDPGRLQYRAECQAEAVRETLNLLGITIAPINGGDE